MLYAKMHKVSETQKTIGFNFTFLSLVAFNRGARTRCPPLATPMSQVIRIFLQIKHFGSAKS